MTLLNTKNYIQARQARIEQALNNCLPAETLSPQSLDKAMRYVVLNGGKRLRALLVYACGEAFGADLNCLDTIACAIECIHAYSLVHDDLPAMDNADLRRGLPTCHKVFDEATAILVGDALQALAFQLLSSEKLFPLSPAQVLKMVQILAQACGSHGMVGGQMLDLQAIGKTLSLAELTTIYRGKTGALFKAAIQLGLLAGIANPPENLREAFPDSLGLAFQIQDDLLDIEASTLVLGKNTRSDANQGKTTYPLVAGIEAARAQVATLYQQAQVYLKVLDKRAEPLRDLIASMVNRHY